MGKRPIRANREADGRAFAESPFQEALLLMSLPNAGDVRSNLGMIGTVSAFDFVKRRDQSLFARTKTRQKV